MATRNIVYIALFTALMAALGVFPPVTVPYVGTVPITAQSMGVMLAGGILGAKRGALSMALFITLVAIGLPLLSGGRGGFGLFYTPSGGFMIGFVLGAFVVGLLVEKFWNKLNPVTTAIACIIGGIGALYLPAIPWWMAVADLPLNVVLAKCAVFIPGDLVKVALATAVILTVKKSYPLINAQPAT